MILKGEDMNGYATVAEAVAAKMPGFKLASDENTWYLVWARASGLPTTNGQPNEPNLYIDNVPVTGITVGQQLMQLNPSMIDHVEANGPITANQGANGAYGLINIYTKRAGESLTDKPLYTVKANGFDRSVNFQSPDYAQPSASVGPSDYRPTIYWNPRVDLFASQSVTLSFFTADQSGRYRVVIEGLTETGRAVHSESVLTVNP